MPPKKKEEDKSIVLHISMPPELREAVVRWCEKNERSFSWTIARALKEFLQRHGDESLD